MVKTMTSPRNVTFPQGQDRGFGKSMYSSSVPKGRITYSSSLGLSPWSLQPLDSVSDPTCAGGDLSVTTRRQLLLRCSRELASAARRALTLRRPRGFGKPRRMTCVLGFPCFTQGLVTPAQSVKVAWSLFCLASQGRHTLPHPTCEGRPD